MLSVVFLVALTIAVAVRSLYSVATLASRQHADELVQKQRLRESEQVVDQQQAELRDPGDSRRL